MKPKGTYLKKLKVSQLKGFSWRQQIIIFYVDYFLDYFCNNRSSV